MNDSTLVNETREMLERIGHDIAAAKFPVVFTGAGISTESGLPDYRGASGLWKNKRFAELANIEMFKQEPVEFWEFYAERLRGLYGVEPNAAHRVLEAMYKAGLIQGVITQNVDGLHRREVFGTDLAELHGSLSIGTCLDCGKDYELSEVEARVEAADDGVPRCDCGYPIKPGVVLFGEHLPVDEQWTAKQLVRQADYLLCLGSSLSVTPAAYLPQTVLDSGGKVAIINLGPTSYDGKPGVTKVEAPLAEVMAVVAHASAGAGVTHLAWGSAYIDEPPICGAEFGGIYWSSIVEDMLAATVIRPHPEGVRGEDTGEPKCEKCIDPVPASARNALMIPLPDMVAIVLLSFCVVGSHQRFGARLDARFDQRRRVRIDRSSRKELERERARPMVNHVMMVECPDCHAQIQRHVGGITYEQCVCGYYDEWRND